MLLDSPPSDRNDSLAGLSGTIEVYSINSDGSLTEVQAVTGFLPEEDTQGTCHSV